MPAMRVSLTARYVSHPTIDFGSRRPRARRQRLGLPIGTTVFHRPRARLAMPSVSALRPLTAAFRFPSVERGGGTADRRVAHSHGSPRVRRT